MCMRMHMQKRNLVGPLDPRLAQSANGPRVCTRRVALKRGDTLWLSAAEVRKLVITTAPQTRLLQRSQPWTTWSSH